MSCTSAEKEKLYYVLQEYTVMYFLSPFRVHQPFETQNQQILYLTCKDYLIHMHKVSVPCTYNYIHLAPKELKSAPYEKMPHLLQLSLICLVLTCFQIITLHV